jgi:hypothetical protein
MGISAVAAAPPEIELKAAFLYNFIQYVEWPAGKLPQDEAFPLCFLGGNPFSDAFDAVQEKKAARLRLNLKEVRLEDAAKACRMLYIGASQQSKLPRVLAALAGSGVLTVADTEGYAEAGVMINLVTRQRNLRFQINLQSARRDGLQISAHLLRLAEKVFGVDS